jgi:hypothetical protein
MFYKNAEAQESKCGDLLEGVAVVSLGDRAFPTNFVSGACVTAGLTENLVKRYGGITSLQNRPRHREFEH